MKKFKRFKKPKSLTKEQFNKIDSTIKQVKECPYCADLKQQIKECMEKHNVKNSLRAVLKHEIKCKDCRNNIFLIKEHQKGGHK